MKKIAVLTSGGDAPGMNSAIRAIVYSAAGLKIEVLGILRGYEGLIDWDTKELGLEEVRNINNCGGTILYSSRSDRFLQKEYRKKPSTRKIYACKYAPCVDTAGPRRKADL